MNHDQQEDGIPKNVKWVMKFVNNIGFPIIVCVWMAYQQFTQGKETIKALDSFKEVIASLKTSIDQQNRLLRRHGGAE